jgi:hypothetical protein
MSTGGGHDADPDATLGAAIRASRMVCIAGLPGVGKSLILERAVGLASQQGRRVHLLRWDGARLGFETEPYSERYPEVDDVTHPIIRRAVGVWARAAVGRWCDTAAAEDVLLAETPLLGNRFLELTTREDDGVEAFLGSQATRFIVIVPSTRVREFATRGRERDFATPRTVNEQMSAAPSVIVAQWTELIEAAHRLGVSVNDTTRWYDPDTYWGVYRRILCSRHCERLSIDTILNPSADALVARREILPTADEVDATVGLVERTRVSDVIEQVIDWPAHI